MKIFEPLNPDLALLIETHRWLLPVFIVVVIWEIVWKLLALWHSARKGKIVWFIFLAIVKSVGILPIIYLLTRKKEEVMMEEPVGDTEAPE